MGKSEKDKIIFQKFNISHCSATGMTFPLIKPASCAKIMSLKRLIPARNSIFSKTKPFYFGN